MQAIADQPAAYAATLATALDALRALGLQVLARTNRQGETRVQIGYGGQSISRTAYVRRNVAQASPGLLVLQMAQLDAPLLIADYVAPPMAERLRALGIEFVDTAGNAHIQAAPMLILTSGRKPALPPADSRPARAFQPGGLKLIFALLCNPDLATAPYRDIAAKAGVALGTVGWVMSDLKQAGFLLDLGPQGRKLTEPRKLLDQWADVYARQLRPRLLVGRFRTLLAAAPSESKLLAYQARWGGETAAAILTGYLKPAITTIYVTDDAALQKKFVKETRLVPDAAGDIELRRMFWHFDTDGPTVLVPPLLAYADLLATSDDRNLETARLIYDDHLARLVEPA